MKRELASWFSPSLNKEMPIVTYGDYGFALLLVPTAAADYLEYERFQLMDHLNRFIDSGKVKVYSIDKKGFEHVVNFALSDWWTGDLASLITQKPATNNIVAVEDSEVFLLSRSNHEILYQQVPKFERFFRILTENSLVAYRQRFIDSISLIAEEQYKKFCKKYPTLLNRLPQKEIAAYLGVTPEFLSKMKSQMFRKK